MTTKLALIGCGSAKNPGVLPAKDKYSSNYFSLKWNYGDAVCDEQLIVSAKYGLLEPDEEIEDYDASLSSRHDSYIGDEAVEEWGEDVRTEITRQGYENDVDEIHILLGSDYLKPIQDALEWFDEHGVEIVYPFEDTSGMGDQMRKLNELTEEARREESPIEFADE